MQFQQHNSRKIFPDLALADLQGLNPQQQRHLQYDKLLLVFMAVKIDYDEGNGALNNAIQYDKLLWASILTMFFN